MIDGKNGETFYKLPGSINGQQFIIQNCEVRLQTYLFFTMCHCFVIE